MTRKTLLESFKIAGYHQDNTSFTRLLIENRVSYQAAREAYATGWQMKQNGVMKCSCKECNP